VPSRGNIFATRIPGTPAKRKKRGGASLEIRGGKIKSSGQKNEVGQSGGGRARGKKKTNARSWAGKMEGWVRKEVSNESPSPRGAAKVIRA